jgi:endonuclease YncB( thermonuclease family)
MITPRHGVLAALLALALAACAHQPVELPAPIAPFPAVAIAVESGDSVVLRHTRTQRLERVRLEGVDAPAGRQPYADRSAAELARSLGGMSLVVTATAREADGSLRGWICVTETPYFQRWSYPDCGAEDSVNAELVRGGHAWARREAGQPAPLASAETQAQGGRAGLWLEEAPVPPWQWRAMSPEKRAAIVASTPPSPGAGTAPPATLAIAEVSVDYAWLFGGGTPPADDDYPRSDWLTDWRGLLDELF